MFATRAIVTLLLSGSLALACTSAQGPEAEHATAVALGEVSALSDVESENLLMVVNKEATHALPPSWRPADLVRLRASLLVPARKRKRGRLRLRRPAAEALQAMAKSAQLDGVRFKVRSAFRSYREQERLFRRKVKEHGRAHAERFSAKPGRSQHQLGTAVDLTAASVRWRIEEDFARSAAGRWLADNAHRFGYSLSYPEGHEHETGYAFEPWHYRFIGVAAASEQRASGLILERYLDRCLAGDGQLRCPEGAAPIRVSAARQWPAGAENP